MKRKLKRTMICCPSSARHRYIIDKFISNVMDFDYPKFDLVIIDTTPYNKKYFNYLKEKYESKGLKRLFGNKRIKILRRNWNTKKEHPLQMLARAREMLREEFLKGNYSHMFNLDSDVLPDRYYLKKLIDFDKDQVGAVIHVFNKPSMWRPATFNSGEIITNIGLDYWDWGKVIESNGKLIKVYGTSFGCLLIKRKVLEKVKFTTHPSFIFGEDLWYYAYANDKGFESYVDTSTRVIHENTNWSKISEKYKKQQELYVMGGQVQINK